MLELLQAVYRPKFIMAVYEMQFNSYYNQFISILALPRIVQLKIELMSKE